MDIPLDEYGTVQLDGSGNGQVTLGPDKFNESWEITTVAVQVSTNNSEPTLRAYRDFVSPTTLIGGTYSGSFDSDTSFNHTVFPGRKIVFRWEGGDAGAQATVRLYGKDVFRQ